MKKVIFGFFILASGFVMSCSKDTSCISGNKQVITETRDLKSFHSIYSNGSAEIYINPAGENGMRIEAESNIMPRIKTEVIDGRLNITTEGCINRHKTIKIYLGMTELREVELNGSGLIKCTETISSSTNSNKFKLNGSGNLEMITDALQTEAYTNGSGNIILKGAAADYKAFINGSGEIHSYDLIGRKVNVSITGSGDAEVYATDDLYVFINGSGNVYYKGNPASVNAKYDGSGDLIKK